MENIKNKNANTRSILRIQFCFLPSKNIIFEISVLGHRNITEKLNRGAEKDYVERYKGERGQKKYSGINYYYGATPLEDKRRSKRNKPLETMAGVKYNNKTDLKK